MRASLAGVLMVLLAAACGSDAAAQPLEAAVGRLEAVADRLGIDTSGNPVVTSDEVPACPGARGVSATVEVAGLARVEMDELAAFNEEHFGDVATGSYFGGLGHPHGLAWVVFDDGSELTVIDSYGPVNTLFATVFDCLP